MAGRKARRNAGRAGKRYASTATAGRTYPLHTNIISTTFWVGELFNPVAADGSQVCSTYDSEWAFRWSGVNNGSVAGAGTDCAGAPLGGCDGIPSGSGAGFTCATQSRTAANNYFPTSSSVTPQENPFYLDLPFDDLNDATGYSTRGSVIPWANDVGFSGKATNTGFSYMKNRWVKLMKGAAVCYAQIQDAGPGQYHDSTYVFGSGDARPASTAFNNAGMDVSPAVNSCLGYASLDGQNDQVNWQFVDAVDVPLGPWTQVVTYSQVEGANGGATYNAAIRPPGVAAMPVGNLTGWTQVVAEDFNTPVAVGGWAASTIATKLLAYDGSLDTSQNGVYDPATVLSVSGSNLDFYLHTDGSQPKVGTVVVANPTSGWAQLYGRFSMRMKAPALAKYKMAPLLWPGSDNWTNEVDFPESHDLAAFPEVTANVYYDPTLTFAGTWQNFNTGRSVSDGDFHVYTIDWTPTRLTFYIDGAQVATTTTGVPQVPMRWTLQMETFISGGPRPDPANKPAAGTNGHVQIDWVAMYEYTP